MNHLLYADDMVLLSLTAEGLQENLNLLNTVNQLLFPTTLFCDLSVMNWFAATNFRDQAL